MKKLEIYLDTSVLNFLFAEDAPEKRDITLEFFEGIRKGKYKVFISDIVIDEITKAESVKQKKLMEVIKDYNIEFLEITGEVVELAGKILQMGVVPKAKTQDAFHIAVAVCNNVDVLLSWNFKHLANINKERLVRALCLMEGYSDKIEMRDPMGVMSDE
ncbi:MAG: PIN domain protein [Deltaproteobacteria bacterium ADurb.Bin135]|nr:MAG: PIN domain protein [Deltaproteobacteria bacterium ADurb.Bin135]